LLLEIRFSGEISDDDDNVQSEYQEDCGMGVLNANHVESIEDQVTSRIATDGLFPSLRQERETISGLLFP
jgi:hypothetical protein